MQNENYFQKVVYLKERFADFFQHRKKLAALENHGQVRVFSVPETHMLSTIKVCMKGAFLEEEDVEWMTKKLNKLHLNYLDWAHKTKWLKQEIASKQSKKVQTEQATFDFAPKEIPVQVPVNLLQVMKSALRARV